MSFLAYLPPFIQLLLEPSVILLAAIKAYAEILFLDLWSNGKYPKNLRDRAFGRFWVRFAESSPADPSAPLVGSASLVPPLLAQARGLTLDIGPGSGKLVKYFEPAAEKIRRIYGVEPVIELHSSIRKNTADTEVGSKYEVLHASATRDSICQELVRLGVLQSTQDNPGIFDTIACVRVLCSVPDLDATISDLYALLKPGGKLLVCEHTVNRWKSSDGSIIARLGQQIYMLLGWSYFIGDCSLTRDIEGALRENMTARWQTVDLERKFGKCCLPYVHGTLTKKE